MDDYDALDGDSALCVPLADTAQRLAVLTLEEAHDLLALLVAVAQEGGSMSVRAERLAREIAARIPSEN
ncbi:DUF6417 family protein [Streptomyces sp. NPDC002265]|uniref:DUF6417 family protein n=1 Tax=Streptomyces sp. NPDC002265 TaxID=3154415 RepID=UPI003316C6BF